MDPFRLLRLVWHNTKTDTQVEQVAVTPGEKTAAPDDVAPGVHVTVEEMPEPTPEPAPEAAPNIVAPETLPPPDDIA